jgi:hypothetical protein
MKKKILFFHYFGGAGGKFIQNCLTFSQQVTIANYQFAQEFLTSRDLKLQELRLLNTIPPKHAGRTWLNREQGCRQLFGPGIDEIKQGVASSKNLNDLSVFDGMWLPLGSHSISEFQNCKNYFSKDEVFTVLVDATPEFIDLAIRLKWPEEHHCLHPDTFKDFHNSIKYVDFDFTFKEWNPLDTGNLSQILDLAKQIHCEFDLSLADNYIKKYQDFHTR